MGWSRSTVCGVGSCMSCARTESDTPSYQAGKQGTICTSYETLVSRLYGGCVCLAICQFRSVTALVHGRAKYPAIFLCVAAVVDMFRWLQSLHCAASKRAACALSKAAIGILQSLFAAEGCVSQVAVGIAAVFDIAIALVCVGWEHGARAHGILQVESYHLRP